MIVIAEISPVDQVAGTRKLLRCTTHDTAEGTGVNGQDWSPAIVKPPVIGIRLFKGGFDGTAAATGGALEIALNQLEKDEAGVRSYFWPGAPIKLWAGVAGQAWPWQQVFEGGIESATAKGNILSVQTRVNDEPFEVDALVSEYAGTGGIEGGEDLKGRPKPMLVGRCFNVAPILINAVDNVYQVHGYGPIHAVTKLYERGSDFDGEIVAYVGDFANYAALVAATIAPGRWGTCLAQGLIRLGAPQAGIITADVDGDKGDGIWRYQAGSVIQRICEIASVSNSLIESASFTAIDTALNALPYDGMMGWYQTEQASVLSLAAQFANDVNHVVGVSLLGKLFASPLTIGSPSIVLDAQGRQDPTVYSAKEEAVSPPFSLIEMGYARSWRVHSEDEIATSGTDGADPNILTIDEKIRLVIPKENTRSGINGRYSTVQARMVALGLSVDALNTASTDWLLYRNSIADWNNTAVHSNIVRATWDSLDKAFDDQLNLADVAISHQTNTHYPEAIPVAPPIGVEFIDADGLRHRYSGPSLLVDGEPLTYRGEPLLAHEWQDLQDSDITQARYQVSVIPPSRQIIYCNENGIALPNQFPPRVLTPIVMMGTDDIRTRADVTYSLEPDSAVNVVATVNNEFGSPDKGRITVTSGSPGFLLLTIRVDTREYGPYRISFERQIALASTSGGTGAKFAESGTLAAVTSTSYSRMAGPLTVTVATGEDVICTAPLTYSLGATANGNAALVGRWRRSVAGAGVWTDLGSPATGTTSFWYQDDFSGEIGAGDFNFTDTAPTPGNYDYELWGAMTNDPPSGFIEIFSGTAKIQVQ